MEELANLITNYGVSIIILVLFIWDWVSNKKTITETLKTIANASRNIEECLKNIEQNNDNISKSLDLLQKSMENQESKMDRLLDLSRGGEKR